MLEKTSSLTNETIPNTLIGLFNSDDKLIYKGYTNTNGKLIIENLALGSYYLQELAAPNGFNLKDEKITFNLTSSLETIYVNLINDPILEIPDTYHTIKMEKKKIAFLIGGICLIIYHLKRKLKHQ